MVNIQWHHSKISPKLSNLHLNFQNFPGGACPQTPLESEATYFAPSRLILWPDQDSLIEQLTIIIENSHSLSVATDFHLDSQE